MRQLLRKTLEAEGEQVEKTFQWNVFPANAISQGKSGDRECVGLSPDLSKAQEMRSRILSEPGGEGQKATAEFPTKAKDGRLGLPSKTPLSNAMKEICPNSFAESMVFKGLEAQVGFLI